MPDSICALSDSHIYVSGTGYGPDNPVAEVAFFDGRSWTIQQAQAKPGFGFAGITAADPSHLWAVADYMVPTAGMMSVPSEIYFGTDQYAPIPPD